MTTNTPTTETDFRNLVTREELAREAGITRDAVRLRELRLRIDPARRIGGAVLYTRADADRIANYPRGRKGRKARR